MRPGGGERDTLAPADAGASAPPRPTWPGVLRSAIRDLDTLWQVLALPPAALPAARAAGGEFPLLVPRGFAARMRPGDLHDPLLRQVLPSPRERQATPGFVPDPVGEHGCAIVPGLLRKYQGRALLITTPACAVHCRYCFRRHFPYGEAPVALAGYAPALAAIAADRSLHEIILSGGDPLTVPDAVLAPLVEALAAIPHVRRLRLHTRLPVVLPERVDAGLLAWLAQTRLRVVVVLHANHPRELGPEVIQACRALQEVRALLLNQAVLLAGVNDDADVLVGLSEALDAAGVVPYYLHLLDPVAGAAHFDVPEERALPLLAQVRARLPGYLVPRLVREVPGAPAKQPVGEGGRAGDALT